MTIPYLLTYAAVEYAYFSLAMTFDIQISRETRFMATTDVSSPTFDTSSKSKGTKLSNYGSVKVLLITIIISVSLKVNQICNKNALKYIQMISEKFFYSNFYTFSHVKI